MTVTPKKPSRPETVLALDVGTRRVGVALADLGALFPRPLTTLEKADSFIDDIEILCDTEKAAAVVLGLPRGLAGQDTAQTDHVRKFGALLEARLTIPVYWNDEALTSVQAEEELRERGKPYKKADIDALAAVYILEDFINTHKRQLSEFTHA